MDLIEVDDKDWDAYLLAALASQLRALMTPNMRPDDEQIPGRDGLEDEDE